MQRDALFDLLARSPASACVVTPNRRLARSLAADFDLFQLGRSQTAWETPQILPFAAFVATLYDTVQHCPAVTGVRVPLTTTQERALWQAVISDSELGLLSPSSAAALASEAWSLAHQWKVATRARRYVTVPDTRAFVAWADEYQRRVDAVGATDLARLPDLVRDHLEAGNVTAPARLVLAGFDSTTPQQQQLFDALAARGTACEHFEPEVHDAAPLRAPCLDPRDEMTRMGDWVAARLTANARARIGVVVPNLVSRRRAVAAALDAVLLPGRLLSPSAVRPYTISFGGPLADVAIVAFFLSALRLAMRPIGFEEASAVMRSPYLAGVMRERDGRDRLDAELRRRCGRSVVVDRLVDTAEQSARSCNVEVPVLGQHLRLFHRWRRAEAAYARRPSEWAMAIAMLLQSISAFAAEERALDSAEFQALVRWRELLAEFAALDRVSGRLTAEAALGQLEQLARETVFQPEGGAPPVQVLGVLEANALKFDHLWIMGLTADAWPPPSQPNPLLPSELQRAAGMPGTSAVAELTRGRRQLHQLMQSASEVIVSHATIDGDRLIAPSLLIAAFDPWVSPPPAARMVDAIAPARLESSHDAVAPPLQAGATLRGGASILQNQAACPFRAFAIHRLDARTIESPHDGFDYRERGQLVHDTLAHFWTSMPEPTRDALAALPEQDRRDLLRGAADTAQSRLRRRRDTFSVALAELELQRLVRIVAQWLQYEVQARAAFRVVAVEDARTMRVGPLTIAARLDRVDQGPDGARTVIDYKTGSNKNIGWFEERPDEPQLPLYLVAAEPTARAIALARVRAGDIGFSGLAAEPGLLPGKSTYWSSRYATWDMLVNQWSAVLERLAVQFAAGDAAVDPKRLPQTCRYCELPTLCRVNERGGAVVAAAADDDENSPWMGDAE